MQALELSDPAIGRSVFRCEKAVLKKAFLCTLCDGREPAPTHIFLNKMLLLLGSVLGNISCENHRKKSMGVCESTPRPPDTTPPEVIYVGVM